VSSPLRAVFLDVGGPLYPDENFLGAAIRAINELRKEGGRESVTTAQVGELFDFVRNTEGASMRKSFAREFLGDQDRASELHHALAPYWRHPEGTLFADVLPFLRAMSPHVRIGIIANQELATQEALTRDGVAPFISSWGLSGLVGFEKPQPEIFHWALRDLGVEAHEAVHIGNRFDTDVLPASTLGLRSAWILRGEAPDHPTTDQLGVATWVVSGLDELQPLLFTALGVQPTP